MRVANSATRVIGLRVRHFLSDLVHQSPPAFQAGFAIDTDKDRKQFFEEGVVMGIGVAHSIVAQDTPWGPQCGAREAFDAGGAMQPTSLVAALLDHHLQQWMPKSDKLDVLRLVAEGGIFVECCPRILV